MSHNDVREQQRQILTTHAQKRMTGRRISETALSAVIDYGRVSLYARR